MSQFEVYLLIDSGGQHWSDTDEDTLIDLADDNGGERPFRIIRLIVDATPPEPLPVEEIEVVVPDAEADPAQPATAEVA